MVYSGCLHTVLQRLTESCSRLGCTDSSLWAVTLSTEPPVVAKQRLVLFPSHIRAVVATAPLHRMQAVAAAGFCCSTRMDSFLPVHPSCVCRSGDACGLRDGCGWRNACGVSNSSSSSPTATAKYGAVGCQASKAPKPCTSASCSCMRRPTNAGMCE